MALGEANFGRERSRLVLVLQSTVLTIVCSAFQTAALIWYLLSYIPGGENGLIFLTKIFSKIFCNRQSSKLVLPI
ncbi:got1/Sft2-like family domain-containing protein [Ditylenchus destructor]|nr:got1/Sft2-like family domain-containing protein [Ditylenchus destructor]